MLYGVPDIQCSSLWRFPLVPRAHSLNMAAHKRKPASGALMFLLANLSIKNWTVLVAIAPPMAQIFRSADELKAGRLRAMDTRLPGGRVCSSSASRRAASPLARASRR
jgi:hypothetical protein